METEKKNRPWTKKSRYSTYEAADKVRKLILENPDNKEDVKVRRLSAGEGRHAFFIKTRLKKEFVEKPTTKKNKKKTAK